MGSESGQQSSAQHPNISAAAPAEPTAGAPPRVLFLDDDPVRAEAFLIENPQAIWVQTVPECLARLVECWDEVHLDHDLGGRTFVDMNERDCGMEVIRWLCKEPRDHLLHVRFFIHTHNSIAGLFMVLQMRSSGYNAEFRPFGLDLARLLPDDDDEPDDAETLPAADPGAVPPWPQLSLGALWRWINGLKGYWQKGARDGS
jgi:hypothetical protein